MTANVQSFDPLATAEEDYAAAVLRLIWDVSRKTGTRTLLCGAVELLPHEVPPPLEREERHVTLSADHFVYATDRVLPLSSGLQWFELARGGQVVRPGRDGAVRLTGADRLLFADSQLDEVPPTPLLATTSRRVPFAANWQTCKRARHLIARGFRIDELWTSLELKTALEWIRDDAHFDLAMFPEYWCSLHLIAPNPIFRGLRHRLDQSSGRPELVLAVDLRAGRSVDGLDFEFESKGPTGTTFIVRKRLAQPIERLPLPGVPEESFERVVDAQRGLLYELGPFVMNWGASVTVTMGSETRSVSTVLADGSSLDYSVSLSGGRSQTMQVGKPGAEQGAVARMRSAQSTREQRAKGEAGQRWFREKLLDANVELRRLVQGAKDLLWVADPYFSGDDLTRVLLAVKNPEVPIRILVGADHLRSKNDACKEEGEHLRMRMSEAEGSGRMNPLFVRVMSGSTPALHDRLLLVGKDLWMLGSSLNAFGGRGTMLLKVPDPEPVLADLQAIWDDSEDFSVWLADRSRTRRA